MAGAVCGNKVLEPGESCQTCAADCVVQPCTATTTTVSFVFDLIPPPGQAPSSATVLLGYRSDLVSIPGTGTQASVLQRVVAPPPPPSPFVRNDANYALSVVLGRTTPIKELFTVTFDRCQGAAAPTVGDFGCAILGCASGGAPIDGCSCTVSTP